MEGTEVITSLLYTFEHPVRQSRVFQVCFISDGEVNNTDEVIAFVSVNKSNYSIFQLESETKQILDFSTDLSKPALDHQYLFQMAKTSPKLSSNSSSLLFLLLSQMSISISMELTLLRQLHFQFHLHFLTVSLFL